MRVRSHCRVAAAAAAMLVLAVPGVAGAHAMVDRAEPRAGSEVRKTPAEVKVWFTQEIEPAFSSLRVLDADGRPVDGKDAHVDPADNKLLVVSTPNLAAGEYKVVWSVVSTDTHRTHGDFKFTVKPQD